ncbi:hypothetical protein Pint_08709 [Pistacia integerrima]|uniref:Uncharacterized protein n=2 Tax=Pistacia integerrima TaxID=434235 RepID=A0ACC0XT11_9ROSI|nr:hypothetical protein Pint_08714 [Pistacia integerrima]KAJ0026127.1 hypothetical protein Pint_08709 [Pistacia integerrima]
MNLEAGDCTLCGWVGTEKLVQLSFTNFTNILLVSCFLNQKCCTSLRKTSAILGVKNIDFYYISGRNFLENSLDLLVIINNFLFSFSQKITICHFLMLVDRSVIFS